VIRFANELTGSLTVEVAVILAVDVLFRASKDKLLAVIVALEIEILSVFCARLCEGGVVPGVVDEAVATPTHSNTRKFSN
jgi:deoxyinosine 3'endonuclease (endonuclease V)